MYNNYDLDECEAEKELFETAEYKVQQFWKDSFDYVNEMYSKTPEPEKYNWQMIKKEVLLMVDMQEWISEDDIQFVITMRCLNEPQIEFFREMVDASGIKQSKYR